MTGRATSTQPWSLIEGIIIIIITNGAGQAA